MAKHWLVQWRGAQLHVPSVWHRAKQRRRTRDVTRWLPSGARRGLCGGGHGAGAPVAGSSGLMDTAKWRLNAFQLRKGPHAEAAPEDEGSLGRCRWPQLGDMRAALRPQRQARHLLHLRCKRVPADTSRGAPCPDHHACLSNEPDLSACVWQVARGSTHQCAR